MIDQLPQQCYRVSAEAIIRNDEGKILLVRERGYTWDLPGGGVEHDEDIPHTLRREIQEELGLAIAKLDERPLFVWKFINTDSGERILMQIGYAVELETGALQPGPDIDEWRYLSSDELDNLPFDERGMPTYLKDFLNQNLNRKT